jgi:hypothetical protein
MKRSKNSRAPQVDRISIAERARTFLAARPEITECLRLGLINHRALGREIARAHRSREHVGYAIATNRYAQRLKRAGSSSDTVDEVFNRASLVVRTQISVLTLEGELPGELLSKLKQTLPRRTPVAFVQAENQSILVLPERHVSLVTKLWRLKTRQQRDSLALVSIVFPERTVTVRGVLARLCGLLSMQRINVIELIGVGGELLLVVEESTLSEVIHSLKGLGLGGRTQPA